MKKLTVLTIGVACFTVLASAHNTKDIERVCIDKDVFFETVYNRFCDRFPGLPVLPEKPEENTCPDAEMPDLPEIPDVEEPETDVPIVPDVPEIDIPNEEAPEVDNNISYEKQVLSLVNAERASRGLTALTWSDELAQVARAHSADMASRNFFSHTNPDGESPFDRIRAAGISYRSAGENIAAGQRTPQEVVNAWMNSEGHRANILNANYTKLGVGYYSGNGSYGTYWTQCFAG